MCDVTRPASDRLLRTTGCVRMFSFTFEEEDDDDEEETAALSSRLLETAEELLYDADDADSSFLLLDDSTRDSAECDSADE